MKGLMFFAAGSILHATGARDMEKLGGLMRRMPWTGCALMGGAVAIAALPPLNGFVSKWLIYLSLIRCGFATSGSGSLTALFAVGLLALIGGFAAVAFVRLVGIILLGSPRSDVARDAHESSPWLLGPILLLLVLCLVAAIIPSVVVDMLSGPLMQLFGKQAFRVLEDLQYTEAPLGVVGQVNAWTLAAVATGAWALLVLQRKTPRGAEPTWGCGYVQPTERMQYTGGSFVEMMAEYLLPRFLRPRTTQPMLRELFPAAGEFHSDGPDPVRVRIYEPFFKRWAGRFTRLRILQQGNVHIYLLYIGLIVILALAWVSLRSWGST
jgi:NADH:ubiquinone oxidoreductase subunit 5 (subunit L)/multisubunit Na+/H+ antiporter MnhA subunit